MEISSGHILAIDWASDELPTLPSVAHQLFAVLSDDLGKISDLAGIISKDPTLSIRVLKVVNSVFYSSNIEVTSIKHAIVILGIKEITKIALSAVMSERFLTVSNEVHSYAASLWRHLLITAVIAQDLAPFGENDPDLYTLGLLHDIGWLVLMAQAPRVMIKLAEEENVTRQESERLWGVDHQLWGAKLLERWRLPEPFQITALRHHDPFIEIGPPDYLIRLSLADYLAHYMGAAVINKPEKEIDSRILDRLAIDNNALQEMKRDIRGQSDKFESLWRTLSF